MYLEREVVLEVVVDSDFDLNYEPFAIQFLHYNQDRDCAWDERHVRHLMNALVVLHGHYLENVGDYWTNYGQIVEIDQKILQNGENHHTLNCIGYCCLYKDCLSKSSKINSHYSDSQNQN